MSNGHTRKNPMVVTASNGIPFPLTNPLHYVYSIFLENDTISKINGTTLCQNGSHCWQQRLVRSHQWLLQQFPVEGTIEICAAAILVLLKRPFWSAHFWSEANGKLFPIHKLPDSPLVKKRPVGDELLTKHIFAAPFYSIDVQP